jgi:hypothetical protein
VTEMALERYTHWLMDASPEFPIHFLKIYIYHQQMKPTWSWYSLRQCGLISCEEDTDLKQKIASSVAPETLHGVVSMIAATLLSLQ